MTNKAKVQIRKRMKALRAGFSRSALDLRSQSIAERVLSHPELEKMNSVALFWPMLDKGEVDLRGLDAELRVRGKRLYYPFMQALGGGRFRTGFALTRSWEDLVPSQSGFAQPSGVDAAAKGDVDLVIVPALAADARGHRIGYGAGFYDATLGDVRPPARAWIVAYQFQMLAELPYEAHDQACDLIVTDERTYSAT